MTTPLGLTTYRWNNNLKSLLLLAAFPCLLIGMVWVFFWLIAWWYSPPDHHYVDPQLVKLWLDYHMSDMSLVDFASTLTEKYLPYVSGLAVVWIIVGLLFQDGVFRMATLAKPLERTENPDLYNLLENLSISRGMATPRLYVMDTPVKNAFASGLGKSTYAITLTRGLIEALEKDEIEAVLAHELSHIINKDVRLMVITVLFGGMLSFFAEMIWRSLSYGTFSDRKGKGSFVIMLIALGVLLVGFVFATLFRLALSRKREFLADAGAVDLTKRPESLISALQKISGNADLPFVPSGVQAMMIENPPSFFSLFDSHPLIESRIAVLRRLGGQIEDGDSIIPKVKS